MLMMDLCDNRHVKDRASKAESVVRANRDKAEKSEREINRVRANIEKEVSSHPLTAKECNA